METAAKSFALAAVSACLLLTSHAWSADNGWKKHVTMSCKRISSDMIKMYGANNDVRNWTCTAVCPYVEHGGAPGVMEFTDNIEARTKRHVVAASKKTEPSGRPAQSQCQNVRGESHALNAEQTLSLGNCKV